MTKRKSFTLIELMAALVLFLGMSIIVMRVFAAANGVVSRAKANSEMYRKARAVLDIIESDLAKAYVDQTGRFFYCGEYSAGAYPNLPAGFNISFPPHSTTTALSRLGDGSDILLMATTNEEHRLINPTLAGAGAPSAYQVMYYLRNDGALIRHVENFEAPETLAAAALLPGEPSIREPLSGGDVTCNTTATGDDVQIVPNGNAVGAGQTLIGPGLNYVIDTLPGGDDVVVGTGVGRPLWLNNDLSTFFAVGARDTTGAPWNWPGTKFDTNDDAFVNCPRYQTCQATGQSNAGELTSAAYTAADVNDYYLMSTNVRSIHFRFFDADAGTNNWLETWNSPAVAWGIWDRPRLPRAVHVTIEMASDNGRWTATFSTLVYIGG